MEPAEVRFWDRVDTNMDDAVCWPWTGPVNKGGYGQFRYLGRTIPAPRVAWEIVHGQKAERGMVVMHSCDNPRCCNPAHLSLGTYSDNTYDAFEKGRIPPKGNRWKR